MKADPQKEFIKDEVYNLYLTGYVSQEEIAERLGLDKMQVHHILIVKEAQGFPMKKTPYTGVCFGHKQESYFEGRRELDCGSDYIPRFFWDELSPTERRIKVNPEHLIDFKQTLERLKRAW